jgi:uncharacterized protein YggE
MEPTSAEPVISVQGEAVLEADPEIAVLHIRVRASDKDRDRALDLLAARHAELLAVAQGYGAAVEKLASEPARVVPVFKDDRPRERITGYAAHGGLEVTVRDFTVLGDLVIQAAGHGLTEVSGPWWALRPDSPVHREARLAAAADALRRARDYAAAFGGQVTGLIEVADQGMLTEPSGRRPMTHGVAVSRSTLAEGEEPSLDLEPARQIVRGHVHARFTMTQPGLTLPPGRAGP